MSDRVQWENDRVLWLLSDFLNNTPCAIQAEAVDSLAQACGLPQEEAYLALLSAWLEREPGDEPLLRRYLPRMVRRLEPSLITQDAYCQRIQHLQAREGSFALTAEHYAAMELFVRDDFLRTADGRVFPQLGWFAEAISFPAVQERGRTWMTITPNEINTMRACLEQTHGRVVTYGLGLGYYAFHALLREDVSSVTVVERSADVIRLFERHLLPLFPRRDRLRIIEADAFTHLETLLPQTECDTVFADLWHDVSDGLPLYRRMKALETPGPRYLYWIEPTLRCYL